MADLPDGYFNLKHRLVGATVLILAAVILLPRVLTGTDAESTRPGVNVPTTPQIQPQVLSEVTAFDSNPPEVSTKTRIEILEQPAVASTDDGSASMESSDFRSVGGKKDRIAEAPLPSDSSLSKSIVTGFIVQVGIFQQPENTRNLISDLKKDGIDAKAEVIEMDGRQATRIWLGPFSTRSEAAREGNKAMMRTHSKPIVREWP
jgi:DedD protein